MKKDIFTPADILLPKDIAVENWSVIACDQFSSERDYWERVREKAGGMPSTLNLIIPEAYLGEADEEKETEKIRATMAGYLDGGIFNEVRDSFIYVERTQTDGQIRRGIVGALDLEAYDFSGNQAAVRASEDTVLERLPARMKIRRAARLELPHIMAFIDDRDRTVIEPLSELSGSLPVLYDSDLMEGGGHIKGMQVSGAGADRVTGAMRALREKNDMLMVIGDGNHSLAAAKVCWDELKNSLGAAERETHPRRRALLEINNVYDPAISFEAIHRVVFDVEPEEFVKAFANAAPNGSDYILRWVSNGKSGDIGVSAGCIGDMLSLVQAFIEKYASRTGSRVDYIHGEDSVRRLARENRCLGLLLPAMDKSELFATVAARGIFPKKSFSVGHARDKRYYLECRAIGK